VNVLVGGPVRYENARSTPALVVGSAVTCHRPLWPLIALPFPSCAVSTQTVHDGNRESAAGRTAA